MVLLPLRVFTLKRSTAKAFAVAFRVLNRKTIVAMHVHRDGNQSGANKDNRLLFGGNNGCYCSPNPRWRLEKSDQSGAELRIRNGGIGSDTLSNSETWKPGPRFP